MIQKTGQVVVPQEKMTDLVTYRIESDQPVDIITERMPSACESFRFSLLKAYNYHELLESKGFPIERKVFVFEICQAKTAAAMLTRVPQFSIFMPCKIAVYEGNGKTVISTINMEIMLDAIASDRELYAEASALFDTLKSLMDSISQK
jgi:uncharacterized protein (DUF302 family)